LAADANPSIVATSLRSTLTGISRTLASLSTRLTANNDLPEQRRTRERGRSVAQTPTQIKSPRIPMRSACYDELAIKPGVSLRLLVASNDRTV